MRKKHFIVTLLLAVGLMIFPKSGTAGMTLLSEAQLNDVVGQTGLSFQVENLNWNMTIETLSYSDNGGTSFGLDRGYFSLCGIAFKGTAGFSPPLMVDFVIFGNDSGNVELTRMNMIMTGMILQVDQFSVDAIRLGSAAGTGNSLGSIYLSNMVTTITGRVQISIMN